MKVGAENSHLVCQNMRGMGHKQGQIWNNQLFWPKNTAHYSERTSCSDAVIPFPPLFFYSLTHKALYRYRGTYKMKHTSFSTRNLMEHWSNFFLSFFLSFTVEELQTHSMYYLIWHFYPLFPLSWLKKKSNVWDSQNMQILCWERNPSWGHFFHMMS